MSQILQLFNVLVSFRFSDAMEYIWHKFNNYFLSCFLTFSVCWLPNKFKFLLLRINNNYFTEAAQCSDGDFRLMSASGVSNTEGRVEVCFLGVWGAIFDPDWTALDASIMCKELHQNSKGLSSMIYHLQLCGNSINYCRSVALHFCYISE